MSRSPLEFLRHIQDELNFLERYRALPDLAHLVANEEATRAVLHSLLIIGGAVKNVPAEWREQYDQVPWRNMARMRNKLTHYYFDTKHRHAAEDHSASFNSLIIAQALIFLP